MVLCRQKVLVLRERERERERARERERKRERGTSYALTLFIDSEQHEGIKQGILLLCAEVWSLGMYGDAHQNRPWSRPCGIDKWCRIEMSWPHSTHRSPQKQKQKSGGWTCHRGTGFGFITHSPEGGSISHLILAQETANMNSRVRRDGLPSRELWTQRNQVTGKQLPINDQEVFQNQIRSREQNHPSSTRPKAPGKRPPMEYSFDVGDLVYFWANHEKTHVRDRYIVVGMTDGWCKTRKFTGSQLHANVYDIKVSDGYPVVPTILLGRNPTFVHDMHNTHLSDEDEPQTSQMDPPPCINCPEPSPVLVQPVANVTNFFL